MESEYENDKIEKAKRGLYNPNKPIIPARPAELSHTKIDVAEGWDDATIVKGGFASGKPTVKILKYLVIVAVVTALASIGYVTYLHFDPIGSSINEKNIQIAFDVPVGVTPGILAEIVVRIANYNKVALPYANLIVNFPAGTRYDDDPSKDLLDKKKDLGSIGAGQVIEFRTTAIFLGEENEEKSIRAHLDYRFEGVNSMFMLESSRPVRLLASPVNLTIDMLKEVNSGQLVDINMKAVSNTIIPLRDMFLQVEYPIGFTFEEAEPKPTYGDNKWKIGDIAPGGKFKLKIRGVLSGDNSQERVFHTSVGVGGDRLERDIAIPYVKVVSPITVKRPFIGTDLTINGKPAGDAVAEFDHEILGTIDWRNNLPDRIDNATIEVRLTGLALDRSSVKADLGFYRSVDNTIIWDDRTDPSLAVLESGKIGRNAFAFRVLPPAGGNQLIANPIIVAEVTVRGKRMSEAGVPEEIKSVSTQNVKVTSLAQFAGRSVYYVGPFKNIGPVPPKVETETTYTIVWSIANTSNTITKARVTGILPAHVSWYGSVSPAQENITFDRTTNQVTWTPGEITAGAGVGLPPREVAFQVVFLPSLSQVNNEVNLMQDIVFTAHDTYTGADIEKPAKPITSGIPTDPRAPRDSGIVHK